MDEEHTLGLYIIIFKLDFLKNSWISYPLKIGTV